MAFTENQREQAWRNKFGSSQSGTDVFGRFVYKSNFEVDHIWPESKGGLDDLRNAMPMAPKSNEEKGNDYQGNVNGKTFTVYNSGTHGIGYLVVSGVKVSNGTF